MRSRLNRWSARSKVNAGAAAHGYVSEGGGEERLADADWSHDDRVVGGLDEPQRAQLVEDRPVVGDRSGVIPTGQGHGRVEAGGAGSATR